MYHFIADFKSLSLAAWLAFNGSIFIGPNAVSTTVWGNNVFLTALIISLTVNAIVTALIVFKILKVYWEVRSASEDKTVIVGSGRKFQSVIFIMIESGIAMFAIQLIRVVFTGLPKKYNLGAILTIGINQMLNVTMSLAITILHH